MARVLGTMTLGFLFLAPFSIGVVTVALTDPKQMTWVRALFWPWISVVLGILVALAMKWEGYICIVMFIPVGLIMSALGGALAKVIFARRANPMVLASFVLLPMASQVIEYQFRLPLTYHEVNSEIHIRARPEDVWDEIKSVRTIQKAELADSWVHKIGFPRPLDAVVNHEGLGGVREARFERGLVFDETIDTWEEPQALGFQIAARPVPPETLDEHVTIGGQYFDVLHGLYEIEPAADGVILHLKSRFRLSTRFNFYSALWTDLIMHRIQDDILSVIQARSETHVIR